MEREPWDSLASPPTYEAAILGQPYVIAPMAPYPFPFPTPTTLHHYIQQSTAPSAPPLSPPSDEENYWRHNGLDLLNLTHQVYITGRRGDKYSITDNTKSLLYTATIDMETTCFCCSSPRGPGITFHLASRSNHHILIIKYYVHSPWCSAQEMEVNVTIPPDVDLGTVEGKDSNFTLNNPSGDVVCYLQQEDSCCSCGSLPHKVVPASFPHDVGVVQRSEEGLMVTFPLVLDPATRTLLIAFALILQYTQEEETKTAS